MERPESSFGSSHLVDRAEPVCGGHGVEVDGLCQCDDGYELNFVGADLTCTGIIRVGRGPRRVRAVASVHSIRCTTKERDGSSA
jgi:hypothetical protein